MIPVIAPADIRELAGARVTPPSSISRLAPSRSSAQPSRTHAPAAAIRCRTPIVILIWNDSSYGLIEWKQQNHYGHSFGTSVGNPDFVKLAEAYGCKGIMVSDPADLDDAIMEMLNHDGPVIFDCLVEKHENCFPMIPSGEPHNKMLLGEDNATNAIAGKGAVLV